MNEIIKEGDYVEYVGRPNEKFLVKKQNGANFVFIELNDYMLMHFYENGKIFPSDTFPLFKKTTPPKKKVVKEFEVELFHSFTNIDVVCFRSEQVYKSVLKNGTKAKLLIEVEE